MAGLRSALITGGTGFLGRQLCQRLLDDGCAVSVLTRPSTSAASVASQAEEVSIPDDFADLVRAVRQREPDVVFHLASQGGASHETADIPGLIEANVTLGCALLEACRDTPSRFVGVGSFWQHSQPEGGVHPNSLYTATKQALEDISVFYREVAGVRAVILKPYDIYGPGDSRRRLLQILATASVEGSEIDATSGEQIVSFVHVRDVVEALIVAAHATAAGDLESAYAVRGPETGPLRQIIEKLDADLELGLEVAWGARPYRPNEVMDPAELPSLRGWQPAIRLSEGFKELLEDARQRK